MKNSLYITVWAATLALAGCLENEPTAAETSEFPGSDAGADASVLWPEPDADGDECIVEPHADSDMDGLLDILEDANRNCRVDPAETDPTTADTDGDGLVDGDEDVDRNGQWDATRGELDPRHWDTDLDGVPDGDEPIAAVCNSTLMDGAIETVVFGDREFHPNRIPIATEARETSVWVEFEGGGVDWLSVDPVVDDGSLVTSADRRVVFQTRSDSEYFEISEWDSSDGDALASALLESQIVPHIPETIQLGSGPFELSRHLLSDGRVRLSVTSAGAAAPNRSASAIRSGPGAVLRPRCVEATPLQALESVDLVFVFGTDEESLFAAGPVFESLATAIEARAEAGLETRLWLVRADAHVHSSAGAPMGSQGYQDLTQVRPLLAGLEVGDADQRVWMNARAALQSLAMGRLEGTPVLITLASREDTEYRSGSTEGYDGHAFGEPHAANEERTSLDAYYAEFFDATVGERQIHVLAGGCSEPRPWPLSARALSELADATYGDLCGERAWSHLERAFLRVSGAKSVVPTGDSVLAGFALGPESFTGTMPGEAGLGWVAATDDGPVHLGYLFWEPASE